MSENYWAKAATVTGNAMKQLITLLGSGNTIPEISEDVGNTIRVLLETNPKELIKLRNKMSVKQRIFLGVQTNRDLADSLGNLQTKFSISDIAEYLQYKDTIPKKGKKSYGSKKSSKKTLFSVKTTAQSAVDKWISSSLKKLSYEDVWKQFMSWVFQDMKPTDLQRGLLTLMRTNGPIARLVIAPTGAGKTFGFGAVMGLCTDRLLCYSPANRTSMQDFIGSTTSAHVPVCYVIRNSNINPKTGELEHKLEYVSIFETMGKAKGSSLEEMSATLLRNKQMRKTRFKTHIPRIVVCDPSMREDGISEIYNEVRIYCNSLKGQRTLEPTLVIDDFCASEKDIKTSIDAHQLMTSVDRIVLLTATPPADMNVVNTIRENNNLLPITNDTYSKTLGMGVSLFSNDNGVCTPVTLLDNLDVFDNSPFALSTLTPGTVFALMKEIYGEKGARDIILSKLPNISLDDLREDIVQKLREIRDGGGDVGTILSCVPIEDIQQTKHGKCLVLDEDPFDRLHSEVGSVCLIDESTGRSWITLLHKSIDRFMTMKKRQDLIQEKCKNSKKRNDGERSNDIDRCGDSINEIFVFPELNPYFESIPDVIMDLLSTYEKSVVSEEELCYILQRQVLIVTKTTQRSWIGNILRHVNTIYGDESMSAGVHIGRLCKVSLPRQNVGPGRNIQGMGRVGRPHQGAGIVIGKTEQFKSMFSTEVGYNSARILEYSVASVCDQLDLIEDFVVAEDSKVSTEVVAEDSKVSTEVVAEKKKSCRSAEARRKRNKKKKQRQKNKKNK